MAKNNFYAYIVPEKKLKGIAASWAQCEKLVKGERGARYRGFPTKKEAEAWLREGARYDAKSAVKLEKGIYFDAGTGRGRGVEISVTDERGKNLLHKVLSARQLNRFGKYLLGKKATNNYGELLACRYALQIAVKGKIKNVFGDSRLIIDYWTKWRVKKDVPSETFSLARETAAWREQFEESGGAVKRLSGKNNPADLGFHK